MRPSYWLTQSKDKPLFPELEWSRPENRMQAGKLLVIGGHLHSLAAPAEAYSQAIKSGAGSARVLLPNALQKTVGRVLENGEFAPSTPSGSFSQKALVDWLQHSAWADGVLITGDLGRNSETAVLLEKYLSKTPEKLILTKDAVDYISSAPQTALHRPETLLVLSLSQLQRLAIGAKHLKPVTFSMGILQLVEWLHDFTSEYPIYIIVKHLNNILVAANGQVSSTKLEEEMPIWRIRVAAQAAVWWMQNPGRVFEGLCVAVLQ
jgi:hypothetical protein